MGAATFHNPEDLRDSIESLQRVHGRDRPFVYWLFLLLTGAAALSLPLIKVDMSVGGQGQVRPAIERISVYPAVDGYIQQIHVRDNQPVRQGGLLMELDSSSVDARATQNRRQSEENQAAMRDLALLLKNSTVAGIRDRFGIDASHSEPSAKDPSSRAGLLALDLTTASYLRQYALFTSQLQKSALQRSKLEEELGRARSLHSHGLISDQDFEQQRYSLVSADRDIDLLIEQSLSGWQADKIDRELKQIDLESDARQLAKQKELYPLRAPIDGTALGVAGLHAGVYVPMGQRLGEISPGDRLQADVYIGPRDIGFVHKDQRVTIQVDAFPYTEWGTIEGHVRYLSQDFVQVGQQMAFKAVVDLETTKLHSSSGVVVDLRRGMTVNGRFIIKKRSLFDLLFGKLSEALDPTAETTN